MENGRGEELMSSISRDSTNASVSNVETSEVVEIESRTKTRTEISGIRIVGAKVLSENGMVESTVRIFPPREELLGRPPPSFYSATKSISHTIPIPGTAYQTVVVHSDSSHMTTTTLSTEPLVFDTNEETTADLSQTDERAVKMEPQQNVTHPEGEVKSESVRDPASLNDNDENVKAEPKEAFSAEEEVKGNAPPEAQDIKRHVVEPGLTEILQPAEKETEAETSSPAEKEDKPEALTLIEKEGKTETSSLTEKENQTELSTRTEKLLETETPKPENEPTIMEEKTTVTDSQQFQENISDSQDYKEKMSEDKISHQEESAAFQPPPPKQIEGKKSAEIQEENIKHQLQEIIKEIDLEVSKREEGEEERHHTWRPKGSYEIVKTPIKYEEVIPAVIPEVQPKERPKCSPKPQQQENDKSQNEETPHHFEPIKVLRHSIINGEPISPLDIPVGLPLLAKILPKLQHEEEESREKIPLERLFTPATDTGEINPQRKKKAFASSCFYRPDHPTIDDQVELAHKISVSLVDEHNKSSKGQTMYMKRKNRSSKWIHQGEEMEIAKAAQLDMGEAEEEKKPLLEKPPLKLVLNPKGMQDYAEVNRYYEELMMSSSQTTQEITRIEVGKEIATNLESPTGKGAALFAKRKKRMDKFIIDETSVRHQPPGLMQEDVVTKDVNTKRREHERLTKDVNTSSHQDTFNSAVGHEKSRASTLNNGPTFLDSTPVVPPGNLKLPDLSKILTQSKPPEKKSSKFSSQNVGQSKTTNSRRARSADSKPLSTKHGVSILNSTSCPKSKGKAEIEVKSRNVASAGSFSASSKSLEENGQKSIEESLLQLRRGSPPLVFIPDGTGGFVENLERVESSQYGTSASAVTNNNEGGAIYKAEVKVVQNTSLPRTTFTDLPLPVSPAPSYTILDHLSTSKEEEKRDSFNLAAKGWGTYSTFYTPVHLGAV